VEADFQVSSVQNTLSATRDRALDRTLHELDTQSDQITVQPPPPSPPPASQRPSRLKLCELDASCAMSVLVSACYTTITFSHWHPTSFCVSENTVILPQGRTELPTNAMASTRDWRAIPNLNPQFKLHFQHGRQVLEHRTWLCTRPPWQWAVTLKLASPSGSEGPAAARGRGAGRLWISRVVCVCHWQWGCLSNAEADARKEKQGASAR
jgi:hypothetical protein